MEGAIERAIGYRCEVDCRLLNGAPISFSYEVQRTGKRIYERDPVARIRYEAALISEWQDYAGTLAWFNRRYMRRMP
ncbi:MAG: hypothetical protein PHV57_10455 [Methanomicrobiaceae archaeon]|nr:hypothetical protein [Methanomicrobiaceae archaeon]